VTFDFEFRHTRSIDDFAADLAKHLRKTQKEKEIREKIETYFVLTSLLLEIMRSIKLSQATRESDVRY
jgi:hypothetical protein